jgi:hypothetical protein
MVVSASLLVGDGTSFPQPYSSESHAYGATPDGATRSKSPFLRGTFHRLRLAIHIFGFGLRAAPFWTFPYTCLRLDAIFMKALCIKPDLFSVECAPLNQEEICSYGLSRAW